MTVNDLRKLINNTELDGDMPVLIPGGDHEYFVAAVGVADVFDTGRKQRIGVGRYQETDVDGSTNAKALVVSCG